MSDPGPNAARIAACHRLVAMRSAIGDTVGFDLCPNPIFDMLLDLYLAQHAQRPVYLWPLCVAANTPLSTAHRKIGEMVRQGLATRQSDMRDGRRVSVRLTDRGTGTVDALLDQLDRLWRDMSNDVPRSASRSGHADQS